MIPVHKCVSADESSLAVIGAPGVGSGLHSDSRLLTRLLRCADVARCTKFPHARIPRLQNPNGSRPLCCCYLPLPKTGGYIYIRIIK